MTKIIIKHFLENFQSSNVMELSEDIICTDTEFREPHI